MESSSSPQLALVLGSGGVRSIAAVGVAEVLTAAGLRPDLIVGCSSGALFGATIALGMTSHQALQAAMALWSAELTRQRRWRAYAALERAGCRRLAPSGRGRRRRVRIGRLPPGPAGRVALTARPLSRAAGRVLA